MIDFSGLNNWGRSVQGAPSVDRWIAWDVNGQYVASLYGATNTEKEMRANLARSKKHGDRVSGLEPRRITVWLTPVDGRAEHE